LRAMNNADGAIDHPDGFEIGRPMRHLRSIAGFHPASHINSMCRS
jgi:hypothetical protein